MAEIYLSDDESTSKTLAISKWRSPECNRNKIKPEHSNKVGKAIRKKMKFSNIDYIDSIGRRELMYSFSTLPVEIINIYKRDIVVESLNNR